MEKVKDTVGSWPEAPPVSAAGRLGQEVGR